jgi:hypothetical protein
MAAPNVINITNLTCKSAVANLTTATGNIITSAANTVIKVNDIILSNYTANSVTANILFNRSSTGYYVAGNVSLPAYSSLVVIGKDSPIYLEEGDVLQANVSANSAVHMTSSYEIVT